MLGFEIDAQPVCANLLRADRTNRAYRHPRESALDGIADSVGLRELHDVSDLVRAGKDRDVRRAICDRVQSRAQWRAVGGQGPSIDRHYSHVRAARLAARG